MKLTETQFERFKTHCLEEYPREAVGCISNGWYKPLENIAEDDDAFEVDSKALYALENVSAVLHSHCIDIDSDEARENRRRSFDGRTPSMADVKLHQRLDVPCGIAECSGEWVNEPLWLGDDEHAPLIGRKFVYHINDCYTLVRAYYKEKYDVDLIDHHAPWEWWTEEDGEGEYIEMFGTAGFYEVDIRDAQEGDVFLMKFRSSMCNHLAVNIGNGKILHHMIGQISQEVPMSKWAPYIKKTLRYHFD